MPTYVYKFIDSGETIEIYQAFSDDALTQAPHPSDGKLRPVKKVFTPVGITFKGGGFYKTDSATSGKTAASGTSASSAVVQIRAQARQLRRQPQRPKPKLHRRINAARGCH